MGCCGNKRAGLIRQKAITPFPAPETWPQEPFNEEDVFTFQYMGNSMLSTTGQITGKEYRFTGKGAVLWVDKRDAHFLEEVPNLLKLD
ncbi:hypothetical protein [Chitinophaga sp. MM2321]|uniref:hypothetical protein n=1 Tax=Chitinophaga sp. MM2321 TaxID=3137178 RepID=UPI0032D59697